MKITAQDLMALGVIDGIIKEPIGGAHRVPEEAVKRVGAKILAELEKLSKVDALALKERRREKFLNIGRTLPGAK